MSAARRGASMSAPEHAGRGTRFVVYPQPPGPGSSFGPETVWISVTPDDLAPGPADARIYVVDAAYKYLPYTEPPNLPPFTGQQVAPLEAGPDGHFDHVVPGTRAFGAAHIYAVTRRVLDLWEHYFGRPVPWHFREDLDRLELIPWLDWNNAHAGYGFIETGYRRNEQGEAVPLCLNFDVIAHELGHSLLYSVLGLPVTADPSLEYLALHESASDLVAIIASLHFDSVIDTVLRSTRGNLHRYNVANRIGELGVGQQIRLASNDLRLEDVPPLHTRVSALSYREIHDTGQPLTGALFDILAEVYQHILVREGLISPALERLPLRTAHSHAQLAAAQSGYDAAYAAQPNGFRAALAETRDTLGFLLAEGWSRLDPDLRFAEVPDALLQADDMLFAGEHGDIIDASLAWRGL